MKAREYELMQLALEDGIAIGYARAHKYTDEPSEFEMKDHLQREVMNQICEWFDFEDQSRELW